MALPPPPALGKEPAGGGVEQAVEQDGASRDQQSDGLVAVEAAALDITTALALLLDGIALQFVVHAPPLRPRHGRSSGSIAESLNRTAQNGEVQA